MSTKGLNEDVYRTVASFVPSPDDLRAWTTASHELGDAATPALYKHVDCSFRPRVDAKQGTIVRDEGGAVWERQQKFAETVRSRKELGLFVRSLKWDTSFYTIGVEVDSLSLLQDLLATVLPNIETLYLKTGDHLVSESVSDWSTSCADWSVPSLKLLRLQGAVPWDLVPKIIQNPAQFTALSLFFIAVATATQETMFRWLQNGSFTSLTSLSIRAYRLGYTIERAWFAQLEQALDPLRATLEVITIGFRSRPTEASRFPDPDIAAEYYARATAGVSGSWVPREKRLSLAMANIFTPNKDGENNLWPALKEVVLDGLVDSESDWDALKEVVPKLTFEHQDDNCKSLADVCGSFPDEELHF